MAFFSRVKEAFAYLKNTSVSQRFPYMRIISSSLRAVSVEIRQRYSLRLLRLCTYTIFAGTDFLSFTASTMAESRYFDLPRLFLFCCRWRSETCLPHRSRRTFSDFSLPCRSRHSRPFLRHGGNSGRKTSCRKEHISMVRTLTRPYESNGTLASLMIRDASIVVKRIQLI